MSDRYLVESRDDGSAQIIRPGTYKVYRSLLTPRVFWARNAAFIAAAVYRGAGRGIFALDAGEVRWPQER
jgi:hypothetical protein